MNNETAGGYPKNNKLLREEMSKILNRAPKRKRKILKMFDILEYPLLKTDRVKLEKLLHKI